MTTENTNKPVHSIAEIGALVQQARKQMKLTQMEAAGLCGVGTRFLSELENGKTTLHIEKVLKVLKGMGLAMVITKKGLHHE